MSLQFPAPETPARGQPHRRQSARVAPPPAALLLAVAAVAVAGAAGVFAAEPASAPAVRRLSKGPVTVHSEIGATVAAIAEPVPWTLRVEAPRGSRVAWPELPEAVGRLQFQRSGEDEDLPVAAADGRRFWERRYRLESFYPGTHSLPALTIEVMLPEGEPGEADEPVPSPAAAATETSKTSKSSETAEAAGLSLRPEPLQLTVRSSLPAEADPVDFRDIKEAVAAPADAVASSSWRRWTLTASVLVLAIASLGGWRWWHRRQSQPAAWARRELKRLRAAETASPATRLAELVAVLRAYLTETDGPAVAARTAAEWTDPASASAPLDPETARRLADLLRLHDRSRFAGATVDRAALEAAFGTAERLLERSDVTIAGPTAGPSRNVTATAGGADVS